MHTNLSQNMNLSITLHIKSVCKNFKHLILNIKMSEEIAKLKSHSIVNFSFLDGDVPRRASYAVYISQLIWFAKLQRAK